MRRIGVCHIISPMRLYGKEKWLLAFMKHLDREMFNPSVITLTRAEDRYLEEELIKEGIVVYSLRLEGKFSFKIIRRINTIIQKEGIDILHSHDYKSDLMAFLSGREVKTRIISTPHGWNKSLDLKLRTYQLIDQIVLRYFDLVVPLSPSLSDSLKLVKKNNNILINNFIDLSTLPINRDFNINCISFIGRLISIKRVGDVIAAIPMLQNDRLILQVIGDGPCRGRLEQMAGDLGVSGQVRFLGFRDDALELLSRSSILVLPSVTEGMPRTVMEAMAMGKVVIGTNLPGIRVLIEDGKTGMLVPTRNPEAIARQIEKLIENRKLYNKIGSAASDYIRKKHSAAVGVNKYEKLYIECLSGEINQGFNPDLTSD